MTKQEPDSVLFNLGELMRIEEGREQEAATKAARAAEAQLERQVRQEEQQRRAAQEAVRAENAQERERVMQETRRQAEREAGLLRVRLEVEARERAERERAALEHEVAMRKVDASRRGRRLSWGFNALTSTLVVAGLMVYGEHLAPQLDAARAKAREAGELADRRAEEIRRLQEERRRVTAERDALSKPALRMGAVGSPVVEGSSHTTDATDTKGTKLRNRAGARRPAQVRRVRRDGLGDLDLDGNDPLSGMEETQSTAGRRGRTPRGSAASRGGGPGSRSRR